MSAAPDPAPGPEPERPPIWPLWKIALVLYPFAAGAAVINLFFLGLLGQAVGLAALTPLASGLGGLALGLPGAWLAARWVRRTIRTAQA